MDDVIQIEIAENAGAYTDGLNNDQLNPQWWLEQNSYPIQVLNKENVKVLIQSKEMNVKYGNSAVVVLFDHGKGQILHMTTHYYQQKTELKTDRHKKTAKEFALEEMNLLPEDIDDAVSYFDPEYFPTVIESPNGIILIVVPFALAI